MKMSKRSSSRRRSLSRPDSPGNASLPVKTACQICQRRGLIELHEHRHCPYRSKNYWKEKRKNK